MVILVILLVPVVGLADLPDISNLTRKELLELNTSICKRLYLVDDFDPFVVPIGYWTVGEHIPAGKYEVRCQSKNEYSQFVVEHGTNNGMSYYEQLNEDKSLPCVELIEGTVVRIQKWPVIFSPAKIIQFGPGK